MTPIEVLYAVRELLDDTRDWYFPNIIWAINKAQISVIRDLYSIQDEYGLRPLYRYDTDLENGSIIGESDPITLQKIKPSNQVLYPRTCYLYVLDDRLQGTGIQGFRVPKTQIRATYLDLSVYHQLPLTPVIPYDISLTFPTVYPKRAVYTLITSDTTSNTTRILFNQQGSNIRAELYYIEKPPDFGFILNDNGEIVNAQNLSLPLLYFPEVIGRAAEILNTQDVSETDRGDWLNVYAGENRLTLEQVLSINMAK